MTVTFRLDGADVAVSDGVTLLDALREQLGVRSVKDGCAPQGQCGCCTVLVDGAPRVACVTPVRRVAGRDVTTVDGLAADVRDGWAGAFVATGASQCGFCTPGIVLRLEGVRARGRLDDRGAVDRALAAHLCRCTGWCTIGEAAGLMGTGEVMVDGRDLAAAARRAAVEGRTGQAVGPDVVLGRGGFAEDTAPPDALVAVPDGAGGWAVGETPSEAAAAAGKVQGRRTTAEAIPPLEPPPGDWAVTLRTSWVEPAYLEPDASWCRPGGEPWSPVANGGAFGGKVDTAVGRAARELADAHGRPVRVVLPREDVVRLGPKRPPIAAGVRGDGGVVRVARTPGVADAIRAAWPALDVEEVEVAGPPTSAAIRAAGWAEGIALRAAAAGSVGEVVHPEGGRAEVVSLDEAGIVVRVAAGTVLDEVVLRSYCIGAAHMALSWVTSESLSVAPDGEVHDLTMRSFGIVRAADMMPVRVDVEPGDGPAVNGSDAVFAAVAAAAWLRRGCPPAWPTG